MRRTAIILGGMFALSFTGLPAALAAALWATGWPQQGLADLMEILTKGGLLP